MTMKKAIARAEKRLTPEQAIVRLEVLCSHAEHSTRELRDRLWQWGISSADADAIIADLTARRFVDDSRFARAYVNDKVAFARWGRRKIHLGLISKHIAPDIIDEALNTIDEDKYTANIEALLRAKSRNIENPSSYEGRMALLRFGMSRGYENSVVSAVLKNLLNNE